MRAFALLLAVAAAHAAFANSDDDKAIAKRAYVEGRRQYDVGEYRAALAAFKNAYLHFEEPAFLFNIAQCHRQLGDKDEALKAYRSYLIRSPDAQNRAEVERLIATLQASPVDDAHPAPKPPPPDTLARPPRPSPVAPSWQPPAVAPPTAPPIVHPPLAIAATTPAAEHKRPLRKAWWLWTTIAGGAALVAAGIAIGVTAGQARETSFQVHAP